MLLPVYMQLHMVHFQYRPRVGWYAFLNAAPHRWSREAVPPQQTHFRVAVVASSGLSTVHTTSPHWWSGAAAAPQQGHSSA